MSLRNVAVLCLALAGTAFAGKDDVMFLDGVTAAAEIRNTTRDSITAVFSRDGEEVETTIEASRLDPYCFYNIRNRQMAPTAENHLELASFCAANSMYSRARYQARLAQAVDPETAKDTAESTEVRERLAGVLVASSRRFLEAGDLERAEEFATLCVESCPGTRGASNARAVRIQIDTQSEQERAARLEEWLKAVEEAPDDGSRRAAEARQQELAPVQARMDRALELRKKARKESDAALARRAYQDAAAEGEAALETIAGSPGRSGEDRTLVRMLKDEEKAARRLAVDCHLSAGSIRLEEGAFDGAERAARKALAVVPRSQKAEAFLARVEAARAMASDLEARTRSR